MENFVKLNNGLQMPSLGLGTSGGYRNEVKEAVKYAIDVGYRHIDTAHFYKNEEEIGAAIKEKIAEGKVRREDLFLVSKLWNCHHREDMVRLALERTLSDLGVQYLDLYLIHWPFAYQDGWTLEPKDETGHLLLNQESNILHTWRAMEKCVSDGLVKSIGLSNFNREQIQKIWDAANIHPVVNQVESHPYLTVQEHIQFCKTKSIVVTAYRPISGHAKLSDRSPIHDPVITGIASKYGKSPAQVLIKFQLQRGLVVIPKSTNKDRIKSNCDVFDFELTPEEMKAILALDKGAAGRTIPMLEAKDHRDYPFQGDFF